MGVSGPIWVVCPHLLVAQAVAAALRSVGTPAEARTWGSVVVDREILACDFPDPQHLVAILDDVDNVDDAEVVAELALLVRAGRVRVVIITSADDAIRWGGLLESDAVDLTTVTASVVELARVVERARAGGALLDPEDRLALRASWARARDNRRHIASLVDTLSPQQRRVLELLATGHRASEVGDIMGVARGTVRSHVKALRAKLGARTQLEAVAMFHQVSDPFDGLTLVPRPRQVSAESGVAPRR